MLNREPPATVEAVMDVDVHGMTWPEAKAAFLDAYRSALQSGGGYSTIRVIHGYGSGGVGGVLRDRFRKFLERHKQLRRLDFKPGEELDRNRGWTLVQPIAAIPGDDEELEDQILDYCQQPQPLDKIAGRFRRYGDPRVKQAVESLLKPPPLLKKISKAGIAQYQAV